MIVQKLICAPECVQSGLTGARLIEDAASPQCQLFPTEPLGAVSAPLDHYICARATPSHAMTATSVGR